jgi:hypothetical protein
VLTISTKDGSISDSCEVTVTDANGNTTPSNPSDGNGNNHDGGNGNGSNDGTNNSGNNPTDGTDGNTNNNGTTDNTNNGSGTTTNGSGTTTNGGSGTTTNGGSGTTSNNTGSTSGSTTGSTTSTNPNEIVQYSLTVVSTTGTTQSVKVNSDVKLSDLATKLGYNVATWHVKQANVAEYEIQSNVTMSALVDLLKNGDLLLIAYDATGNAMGSAKVIKETDSSMTVTLSKDTNVALRSAAEIAEQNGKTSDAGKGATSTTTEGGKQDAVAPSQRTADSVALPFYGALGSLSAALLGILTFLRRKFRR